MANEARLPEITHLQFLVLHALRSGTRRGLALRELLRRHGVRRSGPAFYQMMARLEDAGLVEGRYERRVHEGHAVKERRYEITRAGAAAWEATRAFYRAASDGSPSGAPAPETGRA